MKRKSDPLKRLTLSLAAALTVSLVVSGLFTVKSNRKIGAQRSMRESVDHLIGKLEGTGLDALKEVDLGLFDYGDQYYSAAVIDDEGLILGSSGGPYTRGRTWLRLMISPYSRSMMDFEFADSVGSYRGTGGDGRLALWVDERGEIERSFIAWDVLGSVGKARPRFGEYFPAINRSVYQALGDGYGADEMEWAGVADIGAGQVAQAERYMAWEREHLASAGPNRLLYIPYGNEGRTLVMMYESNVMLYRDWMEGHEATILADTWLIAACWLVVLLIVSLSIWVFRDAQRRAFHPALWGALTLIGNVATLIVYLMVRRQPLECPGCGSRVRKEFTVCPFCGAALSEKCEGCGRALESGWKFCPYCTRECVASGSGEKEESAL